MLFNCLGFEISSNTEEKYNSSLSSQIGVGGIKTDEEHDRYRMNNIVSY
jgi:hypothetical protein